MQTSKKPLKSCYFIVLTIFIFIGFSSLSVLAEKIPSNFYQQLHEFHGHTCGGSLMGARLGLAARNALDKMGGSRKYKAKYFDLSCPVDGIQMAAGSTYGNRRLTVIDQNEHRLVLIDVKEGRKVEAKLTPIAIEKAKHSRELSKKARNLPADSNERSSLEKEIDSIYEWLRSAEEQAVVITRLLN